MQLNIFTLCEAGWHMKLNISTLCEADWHMKFNISTLCEAGWHIRPGARFFFSSMPKYNQSLCRVEMPHAFRGTHSHKFMSWRFLQQSH
jgi:hypothetical protein